MVNSSDLEKKSIFMEGVASQATISYNYMLKSRYVVLFVKAALTFNISLKDDYFSCEKFFS